MLGTRGWSKDPLKSLLTWIILWSLKDVNSSCHPPSSSQLEIRIKQLSLFYNSDFSGCSNRDSSYMDSLSPDSIVGGSKRLGRLMQEHSKSDIFSDGGGEGDEKGLKFSISTGVLLFFLIWVVSPVLLKNTIPLFLFLCIHHHLCPFHKFWNKIPRPQQLFLCSLSVRISGRLIWIQRTLPSRIWQSNNRKFGKNFKLLVQLPS